MEVQTMQLNATFEISVKNCEKQIQMLDFQFGVCVRLDIVLM